MSELEILLRDAGLQLVASIIMSVVALVLTQLVGFLVYQAIIWVRKQIELLKTRLTADQWELATNIVNVLVQQAEQLGITQRISDVGEAKRQWVIDAAKARFTLMGLPVDVDQINSLIESAVRQGLERGLGEIIIEGLPEPVVDDGAG